MSLGRLSRVALAALGLFATPPAFATPSANSGTVTTQVVRAADLDPTRWSIVSGQASADASAANAPTGEAVMQFTVTGDGALRVQATLPSVIDLRPFSSFSFVASTSATRIGDFAYLVDSHGCQRWFNLVLRANRGWQQPLYFIDSYAGQDSCFDVSSVAAVFFQQSGMKSGDRLQLGMPRFEHGVVNHAEVPGPWIIDIGGGTLASSSDAVAGRASVIANLEANGEGQADIAVDARGDGIFWNWSTKSYVTFYYKDDVVDASHYFLVYDANGFYRQWTFRNDTPGQWLKVTADLRDVAYYQSGPVDLSRIVYFEVGVFAGLPGGSYTFQVDEVTVR